MNQSQKPHPQKPRIDWIRAKAPFGGRVCFWLEDRSKFGRKEPSMMLIGCDYHPSWQQISWLDTATGETGEKKLEHASGEAEKFYRGLPGPALIGMESTGNCQWFVEMATTAGHDVWIGDAAKIRASDVRQQKHDRREEGSAAAVDSPLQAGAHSRAGEERVADPGDEPGSDKEAKTVEQSGREGAPRVAAKAVGQPAARRPV